MARPSLVDVRRDENSRCAPNAIFIDFVMNETGVFKHQFPRASTYAIMRSLIDGMSVKVGQRLWRLQKPIFPRQ
jgi:hypothetical protein